MNNMTEMRVLGVTRHQVQMGAYALLLAQVDGPYRLAIVIGMPEAQSIAMRLENIVTARPHTHELFPTIFRAFDIVLDYVHIYDYEEGVFSSILHMTGADRVIEVDVRVSDAVSIALRTESPIFVAEHVLLTAGYKVDDVDVETPNPAHEERLEDMPIDTLQRRLNQHVAREEYEQAAVIQRIISAKTEGDA